MILFLNICTFQRHHKFNWCLHCYQSYKDYRKNGPKKFAYILHHYLEKDMWATCQLKFLFQLFVPLVLFCQQKKFTVIFYIFLFITHFFPQKYWVSLKNFKQQGRKLKKKVSGSVPEEWNARAKREIRVYIVISTHLLKLSYTFYSQITSFAT